MEPGELVLIAQAALFGFAVQILPNFSSDQASWDRIIISLVMGIAGLILSNIWWRALKSGEKWIKHWSELLRKLEPKAYGSMMLLRNQKSIGGTKRIAYKIVYLFGCFGFCFYSTIWQSLCA